MVFDRPNAFAFLLLRNVSGEDCGAQEARGNVARPSVRPLSVRPFVCPSVRPSVRPFVRPSVRPLLLLLARLASPELGLRVAVPMQLIGAPS